MIDLKAQFSEHDLKKQSQFSEGQNDVKTETIRTYGDFNGRRRWKNKANQSQLQLAPSTAGGFTPIWKNKANIIVHRKYKEILFEKTKPIWAAK